MLTTKTWSSTFTSLTEITTVWFIWISVSTFPIFPGTNTRRLPTHGTLQFLYFIRITGSITALTLLFVVILKVVRYNFTNIKYKIPHVNNAIQIMINIIFPISLLWPTKIDIHTFLTIDINYWCIEILNHK